MRLITTYFIVFFYVCISFAQNSLKPKDILKYTDTLYNWAFYISQNIGKRPVGSVGYYLTLDYIKKILSSHQISYQDISFSDGIKQTKGIPEIGYIQTSSGQQNTLDLRVAQGSIRTPSVGISGKIVSISSVEDFSRIPELFFQQKIVLINRKIPTQEINLHKAFNEFKASIQSIIIGSIKRGCSGIIVRSPNLYFDNYIKILNISYGDIPLTEQKPVVTASTHTSELITSLSKLDPNANIYFKTSPKSFKIEKLKALKVTITGKKKNSPISMIAYASSPLLGKGMIHQGSSLIRALGTLYHIRKQGYKPNHTIQLYILPDASFTPKYPNKEKPMAVIYDNSYSTIPRGISTNHSKIYNKLITQQNSWLKYGISNIHKNENTKSVFPIVELTTDSQYYYEKAFTEEDDINAIDIRELSLGVATLISLIELLDGN